MNGYAHAEPGWAGLPPASPPQSPRSPGAVPLPPASPQYIPYPGPLLIPPALDLARPGSPPLPPLQSDVLDEDNSVVVGLKVYTKKMAPSVITGRLRVPPPPAGGGASGGRLGMGMGMNEPPRY